MPPAPRVDELKKRYEENPRRFFAPLANEYRKAGDLQAAIDLCKMHLEEQPGHLSGHIVYAQALFESARPAEARTVFEAALQLDPENLIALRHLGDIAKADGDAPVATQWYQRVLDADPRNEEVTALIESLRQAAPPAVVVAEPHTPPPVPNYAEENKPAPVDSSAATPIMPIEAVAPEPPTTPSPAPARPSIGLMDLDLNLADAEAPQVDLLGATPPLAPSAPAGADAPPPMIEEPAPVIEELPLAFEEPMAAAPSGVETFGEVSLDVGAPPEPALETIDTSFGAEPVEETPTFAAATEPSAFGDSLDVTAGAEFQEPASERLSLLDGVQFNDDGGPVAIGESVTEPKPVSERISGVTPALEPLSEPAPAEPAAAAAAAAEPAAATPSDFDALFGNAPIAEVHIGGDAEPAVADAAGFIADSFVGREATDQMLDQAPDIAAPPSPFVTETMAELYLQQGFRDEALNVYRQLLAQNPEDHGLAERVRHLELGTRSSLAIDSVSEQIEEEARKSSLTPAIPASAIEPLPEAVPAFLVEPPAPAVAEPAPEAAAPPPAPEPVGPSARDVFARIATRRAVPGGGLAQPAAQPQPEPAAAARVASSVATPAEVGVAPGGAIDRLFGMGGVTAVDEGAAVAIAGAFGGVAPAAPIQGEPTRPGTNELSLSSVFKSDEQRSAAGVERQSRTLRFDQFFAGGEGQAAAPSPPPSAPPGAGADDAQFSDWLKGLKGS